MEAGAGAEAGYPDADYTAKGATIVAEPRRGLRAPPTSSSRCSATARTTGPARTTCRCSGAARCSIGFLRPLGSIETIREIAERGVTSFSVELMPRTTRAQSMDALSSMATICGYKAVVLAADTLPRIFPMLTTAAGTITPARVLVIGAGVAGLQAIATARRLGAVTSAYDLRPAAKEQVQSLGGRFVELPIEAQDAEDAGGYATAQDETFYQRQRELLGRVVAESDVVITAAVIPGKKSPVLVTARHGRGHGAGLGDRRPGRRARRQLRADRSRSEIVVDARRHHHRLDQPGQHGPLPRQPDVRQEPHRVPAPPGQGRQAPD